MARQPMTSDLDIFRSANELIEQHGEDAPIHAAMRADELMEAGDMESYGWKSYPGPSSTRSGRFLVTRNSAF